MTRQSRDRLLRIYEQIPEPKWVIAVGICACSGGIVSDSYNVVGGIDQVLPVSMYVPGCPARPEAVMDAIVRLTETI